MLYKNGKKVSAIMLNGHKLSTLWKDGVMIWQSVSSCFGSGTWRSDRLWDKDEYWKSN